MDTTERVAPGPIGGPARSAAPAERLLATASHLFAANGIRAVGIDRILRDSGCAKASLYSSYGSKDALVLAYLSQLDQADRNRWRRAVETATDPAVKVLTFFDLAARGARQRDFRGCLYANAAAEFPGVPLTPVRAHRRWVRATLTELVRELGASDPAAIAREVLLLYDGALTASKLERSVQPIRDARRLAARALDRAQGGD
ncbi:TetR/AcrR family transcriptional regulator [Mycobacterium talmoniae]|uniref:TetR family transcriptional regulator n=1 Tax=Mycobacterium talmoniae TaxID=1858794 RepID=A0A1S1NQA9_9MYCO|nr:MULTISPECIES: TetR/AcrR family transcriptional regulator [Mycobacterium]OHV06539.1 TetR family transcriptional regulator [Mycobacterium talmoniae]TDH56088.1 TetR/AcrR family transcriptional regulator [Mycobacterium eburneum]